MPQLHVDTEVVGRNTEVVAALLREHGLDLVGVTKGCLGEPRVGAAMLAGGATALADTRDHNLRRLRDALPRAELHRIYLPPLGSPFEMGDVTYVSTAAGAAAVAAAPQARSASPGPGPRRVVLAVESGDLREGVPFDGLLALAEAVSADPRLELAGVATNYACFQGGPEGIRRSLDIVAQAARELRAAGMRVENGVGWQFQRARAPARGGGHPRGGDRIALRRGPVAGAGRPCLPSPCRAVPAPACCGPKCSRSILSCLQRRVVPGS